MQVIAVSVLAIAALAAAAPSASAQAANNVVVIGGAPSSAPSATATTTPTSLTLVPAAPTSTTVVPGTMPAASQPTAQASGADVASFARLFHSGGPAAKAKKKPVAPTGVWKWMTYNRSMQPMVNVLELSVDKKGNVTGTLVDRTGEHRITSATLGDGTLSFDVKYHTRGKGDLPHTFTVNLDPDQPAISEDIPDVTPFGQTHGGKRREEHPARHADGK
jgi:hypothetical protein